MHKGYGKQLLAAAVNELSEYDDIFLWVLEDNTNARRFYEAQGFTATEDYLENDIGGKTLREVRYRLSRNRSKVDKY
jgi:ribosomal protein S18 acetylase RimI-like enzyme